MSKVTFILPLPPSVNSAYRNVRGVGRVKTKAARDWHAEASAELMVQRTKLGFAGFLFSPLSVAIAFRKSKADIDNRTKLLLDLCTDMRIWMDDSQIEELHIYRRGGAVAECTISIEEIFGQRLEDMGQGSGRAASD